MPPPERPLLVAPPGVPDTFRAPGTGGSGARGPKKDRQVQRLTPKFAALADALDARRAALQSDPSGPALEQVLVIETNGTAKELYETVSKTPGLEWLADDELRELPPDEDFFKSKKPDKPVGAQLYLILFNQQALENLLSLWKTWSATTKTVRLPEGLAAWGAVFRQLRDIRRWGVQDRLAETDVLEFWRDRVKAGDGTVWVEIELWFRSREHRAEGERRVRAYVSNVQGQVGGTCVVNAIAYHAILAKLPIAAVQRILEDPEVELLQCDDVRLFRPTGQAAPPPASDDPEIAGARTEELRDLLPPVIGLLDGLPIENHEQLAGRLVVDDPDGWSGTYPVQSRFHGTTMASLILHGDLAGNGPSSRRRIYVRPILRPAKSDERHEVAPEGMLWVDLIHRAVRRIVEGDGELGPVAPTVKVINLSIGDPYQPFLRTISPLARLLDWLAWRYRVLFVVAAGNHPDPLTIAGEPSALTALQAIASLHRDRRILSPSEAMNVLTVGAASEDASGPWAPRVTGEMDFDIPAGVPSLISGWGRGYRRIVKPDVLAPGGRSVFVPGGSNGEGTVFRLSARHRFPPGQLVAAPGVSAGDRTATRFTSGTSNGAAVTSRVCGAIANALEELAGQPNSNLLDSVPTALWIRTLLAHGASWRSGAVGLARPVLRAVGPTEPTNDELAAVLGFGLIEPERVVRCAPERVTVLAGGAIRQDERILHKLRLPASLNAYTARRRLIVTLSWFSPINPSHRKYRCARLWFDPPTAPLGVARTDVAWQAAKRGTLQHEVLEGDREAIAIVPETTLEVPVSCVEDAGPFTEPIPYALAVTIELAPGTAVRLYDDVRTLIQPRVAVRQGR